MLLSKDYSDSWLSGIAFSKNLWGHAVNSAVAYHWAINGGNGLAWNSHDWNSDILAYFPAGSNHVVMVPVVANGKDKLLYMV